MIEDLNHNPYNPITPYNPYNPQASSQGPNEGVGDAEGSECIVGTTGNCEPRLRTLLFSPACPRARTGSW